MSALCVSIVLCCSIGTVRGAELPQLKTCIDWQQFLSRHDLVWTQMPQAWNEAPFLGNGMLGTMLVQQDPKTIRWEVGRGDVQDHRPRGKKFGYDTCRLPIGHFELTTVGAITGGSMRLDLWNAEARGEIQTDRGSIKWQTIVHADHMAIIVRLEPSAGETDCRWNWKALPAKSPRLTSGKKMRGVYQENPPPQRATHGEFELCIQPLLCGGETVTAWHQARQRQQSVLTITVAHTFPEASAQAAALDELKAVTAQPMAALLQSHRDWWHGYYPASFVSFADPYWESFYWIQMYKLASTTRADRMLIDNQGPWIQTTPWPGAWWNLNVQLSYWPTYASNRHHLSHSLERTLYDNVETLIQNVPQAYQADSAGIPRATGQDCAGPVAAPNGRNQPEIGLLLWACHNSWLHYRHTMDDAALRHQLFPLLRRAVNFHLHFVHADADGTLHLPPTFSPEYGKSGPDCNFDLALLRWGCGALIDASARLQIDDPLVPRWKAVLANLAAYPVDQGGYMIARDTPFAKGHRHYSHLLMLYPLYLETREMEGAEQLMLTSVRHWQSKGARQGYSLTGASSISSAFGRGNDALEYLNGLIPFLQPNTLYQEAGPVIETPLSGAQSIHDMLIQSWGGTIRIFPAVPDAWGDIAVHDLSTEGAFLISAKRRAGKTEFIRIKSRAGEPCVIIPGLEGKVQVAGSRQLTLEAIKPGVYALDLQQGEEALLWGGGQMPDLTLEPVATELGQGNPFGLN
jgi:alpha-L-fucosidase 2